MLWEFILLIKFGKTQRNLHLPEPDYQDRWDYLTHWCHWNLIILLLFNKLWHCGETQTHLSIFLTLLHSSQRVSCRKLIFNFFLFFLGGGREVGPCQGVPVEVREELLVLSHGLNSVLQAWPQHLYLLSCHSHPILLSHTLPKMIFWKVKQLLPLLALTLFSGFSLVTYLKWIVN